MIELVVFDMAGTTVDDSVGGQPLVSVAMISAMKKHGLTVTADQITPFRGMEKKDALRRVYKLAAGIGAGEELLESLFRDFKSALDDSVELIDAEIPGSSEVFRALRQQGIKIAVGSGFPHKIVQQLVRNLHWDGLIDYIGSAELVGAGRPDPALIFAAMQQLSISDPRAVLKVGDTCVDVEEGRNANAWTAAVLTGTQTRSLLEEIGPDYIVGSVMDVPALVSEINSRLSD